MEHCSQTPLWERIWFHRSNAYGFVLQYMLWCCAVLFHYDDNASPQNQTLCLLESLSLVPRS